MRGWGPTPCWSCVFGRHAECERFYPDGSDVTCCCDLADEPETGHELASVEPGGGHSMTATKQASDVRAQVFAAYQRQAGSVLHRDHKGRPIRCEVFRAVRDAYARGIAEDVAAGREPWGPEVGRFRLVNGICERQNARVMRRVMAEMEAKS